MSMRCWVERQDRLQEDDVDDAGSVRSLHQHLLAERIRQERHVHDLGLRSLLLRRRRFRCAPDLHRFLLRPPLFRNALRPGLHLGQ